MYFSEQVAKLYQAVFEEYDFKKMEELKLVKSKIDNDELDQKVMGSSVCYTPAHILICSKYYYKSYNANFHPVINQTSLHITSLHFLLLFSIKSIALL